MISSREIGYLEWQNFIYCLLYIKNIRSTLINWFRNGNYCPKLFKQEMGSWTENWERQEGYYNYQEILSLRYHITN